MPSGRPPVADILLSLSVILSLLAETYICRGFFFLPKADYLLFACVLVVTNEFGLLP